MKKHNWTFIFNIFLLSSLLLTGCKKPEKVPEEQIPMDAMAVMVVNNSSIFTKIALDQLGEVSMENLFGGKDANRPPADPDSDEARWKRLMDNPEDLGVDILADIYIIAGESKGGNPTYMATLLELSSQEKLEAYLNGEPPRMMIGDNQQDKGFTYRLIQKGEEIIAWNNRFALYLEDKTNGSLDLVKEAGYILNLPSDKSMMERESFRQFMDAGKDLGLFVNAKAIDKKSPWIEGVEATHAQIKFRDGEIQLKMHHYLQDKETDLSWLEGDAMKEAWPYVDFVEPIAFANLRYNAGSIDKYMQAYPDLKSMMANTLEGTEFSIQDIDKLFTGEALFACTGIAMLEKEVVEMEMDEEFNMIEKAVIKEVPAPEYIIALPSKAGAWHEVAQGLSKQEVLKEESDGGFTTAYPDPLGNTWKVYLDDLENYALVVNTPELPSADHSIATTEGEFLLQSYPSSIYVNFPRLIEASPITTFGKNREVLSQALSKLEIGMKKGDSAGEIQIEGWVRFQDRDRNALTQLIVLFQEIKGNGMNMPLVN